MAKPVFYDPRQSAGASCAGCLTCSGVSITLLVVFFVYTAIRDERLPGLFLPDQKRPYHALKEKEKEKGKAEASGLAAPPQDEEAAFAGDAECR